MHLLNEWVWLHLSLAARTVQCGDRWIDLYLYFWWLNASYVVSNLIFDMSKNNHKMSWIYDESNFKCSNVTLIILCFLMYSYLNASNYKWIHTEFVIMSKSMSMLLMFIFWRMMELFTRLVLLSVFLGTYGKSKGN